MSSFEPNYRIHKIKNCRDTSKLFFGEYKGIKIKRKFKCNYLKGTFASYFLRKTSLMI